MTAAGSDHSATGSMRGLAHTYWEALGTLRRRAVMAVGLATFSGLMQVAALATLIPLLQGSTGSASSITKWLREHGLSGDRLMWTALIAFVVFGLLAACSEISGDLLVYRIRSRVEQSMRTEMSSALIATNWPAFIGLRMGDVSASVMMEGGQTSIGVQAAVKATSAICTAVIFVIAAAVLNWQTTLLTLAFGVVLALAYRWAGRGAAQHGHALAAKSSDIGNKVGEVMGNLKFVKSTGGSRDSQSSLDSLFSEFAGSDFRTNIYRAVTKLLFESGGVLFVGGVIILSIVTSGSLTAEGIVFIALFYRLLPILLQVQDNLLLARTQRAWYDSWRRRLAIISREREVKPGGDIPTLHREISLEHVSFRYSDTSPTVLDDVSITVPTGQCLALVGESGSGKTTILDLLSGLLQPVDGRIALDGVSLTDVDLERWRARIGLVLQESPVFHATVLENIAWYADSVDEVRVRRCAEQAFAEDFIEQLPEGMSTVVGERGGRLSGGQRQRIALARALYRDPWLLLLDEATSSLDGASEAEVQLAIERLKGTCTVVMVAHRLSTVQIADRILVLDRGRIVEEGTWDELLDSGGQFAVMAQRQGLSKAPT